MIEVQDNRLDLKWINTNNKIGDQFTMMKNVNKKSSYTITEGDTLRLTSSFNATYNWNLVGSRNKSILLSPASGRYSFIVKDNPGCVADTFLVEVKPNRDSAIIAVEAKFLNKRSVQVNWQYLYADEGDVRRYVVERSANNVIFNDIKSIPKSLTNNGSSTANYNYIDSTNIIVRKLYYRIKVIDLLGVAKYSKSVVANFNGLDLDENIVIAPNPGKPGDFRIQFKGGVGTAAINVYDMAGRQMYTTSILLNTNFKPLLPSYAVLPPGIYIVRVAIDDDFVVKRILVL